MNTTIDLPPMPPMPPMPPLPPIPPPAAPRRDRRPGARGPGRMLLIVMGAVLTFCVIGWSAFSVVGLLAHEEETSALHFTGNIRNVVVWIDSGGLTVRGSDRGDVGGERKVSRGLQSPTLTETLNGDTLVIRAECAGISASWCGVTYNLDVPRDVNVDVESSAGGIRVSGIRGATQLRSSGGGLTVNDISGQLSLDTSAGGIDGTNLRSSQVNATSSAGGIQLAFVAAPDRVSAFTSAGGIDIQVPRDATPYRVDTETRFGDAVSSIAMSPDGTRVISAGTSAGEIAVHYP